MAERLARPDQWVDERGRRLDRSVVMHGTSPFREEAARLLARLVEESGAQGAAYGWTDALGPETLVPVHAVAHCPDLQWDARRPESLTLVIDQDRVFSWKLMLLGRDPRRSERTEPLMRFVAGWFGGARCRDVSTPHERARAGPADRFVRLLDAYRFVSFRIGAGVNTGAIRSAFRGELSTLPERARAPAVAVIDLLSQPESLAPALLELGMALDAAGALPEAVSVHLASYELALQRCDAPAGIDAARSAGRAYRLLAEWTESFRWYGLARRLAELEVDLPRLAIVLDGAGNTYRQRGSFPAARAMYRDAWRVAVVSGDREAIGNVGHSMMTVEREAGRLASAARYGWTALRTQTNSESRANLLLNIGTLLREGGDFQSARDAYHVARADSADVGIRMMAADGLAYCSALTNGSDYAGWRAVVRRESRGASPYLRAQVGYFRGVSLRAFGRHAAAVRVLRAVERYARAFGLTEWQVKAAEAADEQPLPQPVALETPRELRQGLCELREAAV